MIRLIRRLSRDLKKCGKLGIAGAIATPIIGARNGALTAATTSNKGESNKIAKTTNAALNKVNSKKSNDGVDLSFRAAIKERNSVRLAFLTDCLILRFWAGGKSLKSSGVVSLVGRLIIFLFLRTI